MSGYVAELARINEECSSQLSQVFARAGIAPWWENSDSTKGGALFGWYDPTYTCLRVLPNAPRYFQSALRGDLISQKDADVLGRRLLKVISTLLPKYSGFFSQELKQGIIGEIIRKGGNLDNFRLYEAHQNLLPDDIYRYLMWPCLSKHFTLPQFAHAGIKESDIREAAKNPLRAITVAADVVNLGPGLRMSTETILSILDCLQLGGASLECFGSKFRASDEEIYKIAIPSFSQGLQGFVFGMFNRMRAEHQPFIINQLQQFATTLGEKCAWVRERQCLEAMERASSLSDFAHAFRCLLPPVTHVVFESGSELIGFKLREEADYLAGYQLLMGEQCVAARDDGENDVFDTNATGRMIRVRTKMVDNPNGLNAVYTAIRTKARVTAVLSQLRSENGLKPLIRTVLDPVRASLERQIQEGRGAAAACKKLYLIDFASRHYEKGEMLMSNQMCRDFVRRMLGDTVNGYHVSGKAVEKYEAEIAKVLPNCFGFEPLTRQSVRVRWRPVHIE